MVLLGVDVQWLLIVHIIDVLRVSFLLFILRLFFHLNKRFVVLCITVDIVVVGLPVVMCRGLWARLRLCLRLLLVVRGWTGLGEVEIKECRGILAALDSRVRAARKVGRDEVGVRRDVAAGVLRRR